MAHHYWVERALKQHRYEANPRPPAPIIGTRTDTNDNTTLIIMIQSNRIYSSS